MSWLPRSRLPTALRSTDDATRVHARGGLHRPPLLARGRGRLHGPGFPSVRVAAGPDRRGPRVRRARGPTAGALPAPDAGRHEGGRDAMGGEPFPPPRPSEDDGGVDPGVLARAGPRRRGLAGRVLPRVPRLCPDRG